MRAAYMWVCMLSVDGPMLMYALPLIFLLTSYLGSSNDGLNVSSPIHFWMGWVLMILIMLTSFTFQIAFLPSIRVWYEADGDYSAFENLDEDEDGTVNLGEETVENEVITFGWDTGMNF